MPTKPAHLRAESHAAIGAVIQRDAGVIIDRWARRAAEEQPSAKRAHHDVLLDHFPTFLWELGRSLMETGKADPSRATTRRADEHGDQRWEAGWSITEVVRDYQLLRLVLIEYLEEALDRSLRSREVMALGVAIDDAIATSVAAFVACEKAEGAPPPDAGPSQPEWGPGVASPEGLLETLGVLGHELRNPLAPIGNALRFMNAAGDDPAKIGQARALIERQFTVMVRLVDDLLDVPRLLRGKMSLKHERLELVRLVRQCADDRKLSLEEAGLRLTLDLPAAEVWATGDGSRLNQVVGNLLHNAQKFTNSGGEVRVRLTAATASRTTAITVSDTGIGIDPAFLPRVFETFMQADRSVERSRGGLGLGLALAKGIVELHGGAIRVASAGPGRGTEFTVELPLVDIPSGHAPETDTKVPGGSAYRVLIVEDNRDSAESLRMYLELLGHETVVAHSGVQGLEIARTFCPEVIVTDIGLPGMSGDTLCAELRKDPRLAKARIIALSGHASGSDREECLKSGFDVYFVKPVDPTVLVKHFGVKSAQSP